MHRSLLLTLASAAAFAFLAAAPASAQDAQRFEARIPYGDLNLNSDAGVEVLLSRITNEARSACGHRFGRMSVAENMAIRACVREFEAAAVGELDNARVNTRFADRGGAPRPALLASR
jgi:UrcA family protein